MESNTNYIVNSAGETKSEIVEENEKIDKLYQDTMFRASCADTQASIFKFLYILSSIFITLFGSAIGLLNLLPFNNNNSNSTITYTPTNITNVVLGFTITIIKALLSLFLIEKRSYLLKDSAIKLRKYAREIKTYKSSTLPFNEILLRLDEIQTKIDELDIYMFSNGANDPTK